jgi:hypothetical protein
MNSGVRAHYANMRYTCFDNLRSLPNECAIDLKHLTSGSPIPSCERNEFVFKHMFEYIKRSVVWYKAASKHVGLVQSGSRHHLIENKLVLAMIWLKITELVLNNNHSHYLNIT